MSAELNQLNLVQVLDQASNPSSMGSDVQKLAEQQLKSWEIQPGYHYFLQSIYLDLKCSLQVRWLAVIQFKNGLEKYWRATRVHAISKDEKVSIRDRLFDMFDEQNNQLSIQNARACARIARTDYPQEWPSLFENFEKLLTSPKVLQDNVRVYNILLHLNQIVKILAAARIVRCRPSMQSKMPLLFPLLVRVYVSRFNQWTSSNTLGENELSNLHVSYLASKVLRRVITDVYEAPHKDQAVVEYMDISVRHFELLLSNHSLLKMLDIYEKFVKGYEKLYYNLMVTSPSSFILMPCCCMVLKKFTNLLMDKAPDVYQENAEVNGDFWEQVSIRAFSVLRRVMHFIHKKGAISIRGQTSKAEVDAAIGKINVQFLTPELVKNLVDLLLNWYLKLRPAELEHWAVDPEDWINEQMSTNYEYQIRPCAENFFQELLNCFPDLLAPYLLAKIQTNTISLSSSLDELLQKDSMFAAFQLGSNIIADMVDFDTLLVQVFLPEALNESTAQDRRNIVRRRVSLVINDWCTVRCSNESKQNCYKYFSKILSEDEDKVVQLSAIQSLRTMVDDWNFEKNEFEPYLNDIVTLLLRKILPSVNYTETRLYVLNTLSDIVIQTKDLIGNELLMQILQLVPELWDLASNDQSQAILANALLRLLRYLFMSLGAYSYNAWSTAIPILQVSCDPSSPHFSLLYEDGYELWHSVLENFDPTKAQLDNRMIQLVPFLEYGVLNQTEVLPTILDIVKSYSLILPREQFFSMAAFINIFQNLASYLLKLRDDSFDIVLSILDILSILDREDKNVPLLTFMYQTGVFKTFFDAVFLDNKLSNYQMGQILQPIARVAFLTPSGLLEVLGNYHVSLPNDAENAQIPEAERLCFSKDTFFGHVIKIFLDRWAACFSSFYDPKIKKIHLLGVASLLKTGVPSILSEFPLVASLYIEMLEEANETIAGDCPKYHTTDDSNEQYELTCEQIRLNEVIRQNDPAHRVSLKAFLKEIMLLLKIELGDQYAGFLNSVDNALLANLEIFLSIPS